MKKQCTQNKPYNELTYQEKIHEIAEGSIGDRRAYFYKCDNDPLVRLYAGRHGLGFAQSSLKSECESLRIAATKYLVERGYYE